MTLKCLDKLSQDFTQLLKSEYGYNVIFKVGENPNTQIFKAHSAILYQRSSYFQQKLINTIKNDNIIEINLPLISAKEFNTIIKYIYSGIISLENFEASSIFDLLIIADEFNLSELVVILQTHLIGNNASWLRLKFSRIYCLSFQNKNFNILQQFYNNIIVKHPSMLFNSNDFPTLHEDMLISLLECDDLQMEESEIWDKIILWGKKNTPNLPYELDQWTDKDFNSLKATLRNCLPHIRYFQISCDDVLKKIQPYQRILEKNIWDDVISKFINPNIFITSTFLPPRKKIATQLPPRGESIIIPSSSTITLKEASNIIPISSTITLQETSIIIPSTSIISLQHVAEISSWIDRRPTVYDVTKIPYVFKLLLRGSRDGFACEIFHKLCDNIPGTIVVAKNYSTDEIVGGYNPLIWKISNFRSERATTADSFIFSLKNRNLNKSILSRVSDASKAILYGDYITTFRGPWFGSDLGMRDKTYKNSKTWYCTKHFYEHKISSCQSSRFPVDDYEVFQIINI